MNGYRILGALLLVVAIVTAVNHNWIATAFCAVIGVFCMFGKVDRGGSR